MTIAHLTYRKPHELNHLFKGLYFKTSLDISLYVKETISNRLLHTAYHSIQFNDHSMAMVWGVVKLLIV